MTTMTPDQLSVWDALVEQCKRGGFSSINVASKARTEAILAVNAALNADTPLPEVFGSAIWSQLTWNQVNAIHLLLCPHLRSPGGSREYEMSREALGAEIELTVSEKVKP